MAAVDLDKELVLVDDCSTDGSREILEEIATEGPRARVPEEEIRGQTEVRVLFQPRNQGKGAALRRGFAEATGDIVVIQDADLEYDPREYRELIAADRRRQGRRGLRLALHRREPHRVLYFWHSRRQQAS